MKMSKKELKTILKDIGCWGEDFRGVSITVEQHEEIEKALEDQLTYIKESILWPMSMVDRSKKRVR